MEVALSKVLMAALMALLVTKDTFALVVLQPNQQQVPGADKILRACPAIPTLAGFTKANFDGMWHVYKQTMNVVETGWTCKTLNYNENTNAFAYSFKSAGAVTSYVGTYSVPNPAVGAFAVVLQYMMALGADSFGRVNQFVVAGVPTEYMILKSCTNYALFNHQNVYVLTRMAVPSAATQTAIAAALNTAGITAPLQNIVHTGC